MSEQLCDFCSGPTPAGYTFCRAHFREGVIAQDRAKGAGFSLVAIDEAEGMDLDRFRRFMADIERRAFEQTGLVHSLTLEVGADLGLEGDNYVMNVRATPLPFAGAAGAAQRDHFRHVWIEERPANYDAEPPGAFMARTKDDEAAITEAEAAHAERTARRECYLCKKPDPFVTKTSDGVLVCPVCCRLHLAP